MNLLSIAQKLWFYKFLTLPIALLTLCGAVYVIAIKEPVYEAKSSYVLINPPAPPTTEEIARDPALGRINSDNPYTRFADQSVVVEVLASSMTSESAERALLKAGVDPRYKVTPISEFGFSSPIVQITAQGGSPDVAVRSARLVGSAVARELDQMQKAKGVDSQYWIEAQPLETADGAKLRASGQLRVLVGVLALGALLIFVVVSAGDGLTTLRMDRVGRSSPSKLPADDLPWSAQDRRDRGPSALTSDDLFQFAEDPGGSDQTASLFPDPDPDGVTNGSSVRRAQYRQEGSSR